MMLVNRLQEREKNIDKENDERWENMAVTLLLLLLALFGINKNFYVFVNLCVVVDNNDNNLWNMNVGIALCVLL